MADLTADKLVAIYIKIRGAIKEKDDEIKLFKEQQEFVAEKLLALCSEQNLDSMKTTEGTITRRVSSNYWTSDWESMHKFALEHEVPELFEKRLNQTHMKQFLEENPDLVPMGLNVDAEYILTVRKK